MNTQQALPTAPIMPSAAPKRKHSAIFNSRASSKPTTSTSRKPGRKSNASSRRGPASSSEAEDEEEDEADDDGDEEEDEDEDVDKSIEDDDDDDDDEAQSPSPTPSQASDPKPTTSSSSSSSNPPPSLPPKLLAKLLHHHLASNADTKDMRIDKAAMSTLGRYIETFTREAIARAAFERGEENAKREERGERVRAGDKFLEVSAS